MGPTLHQSYTVDEAIAAFGEVGETEFLCEGQFAVLPTVVLCFFTLGDPVSEPHVRYPSRLTWKPRRLDYDPSDTVAWFPEKAREVWKRGKQASPGSWDLGEKLRDHHVFIRLPDDERFFYAGKAHMGGWSGLLLPEKSADFDFDLKLPRDDFLRFGWYLTPRLKEETYPIDGRHPTDSGSAGDLTYYTDSLDYYIQMYEQFIGTWYGKTGPGFEPELAFAKEVHAMRGLIAKGISAVPYIRSLLQSSKAEARSDGACMLAMLGNDDSVVQTLLEMLPAETDQEARDTLIVTLGRLKTGQAIPVLADIIRDEAANGDTKWLAVESLGLIVRKKFTKRKDPIVAAIEWLTSRSVAKKPPCPPRK